ncbi:hypothetical protein D5086_002517 [Populus alba]|uniref:Uncharacterized protein n=1 Tax=Populus alba TaxID=43335 RepID=A0ACC4D1Y5_POPAL
MSTVYFEVKKDPFIQGANGTPAWERREESRNGGLVKATAEEVGVIGFMGLTGLGRQILCSGVPPLLHYYQSAPPFSLHVSGLDINFSVGCRLVTSDLSRRQWPITCDMLRLLLKLDY